MGSDSTATVPARVMTSDSTVAKMGRSMKNREIMASQSSALTVSLVHALVLVSRLLTLDGHGHFFRLDSHLGPDHLQAADNNSFASFQPVRDDAQTIFLQRARLDAAVSDDVFVVHDQEELLSLVAPQGLFAYQESPARPVE